MENEGSILDILSDDKSFDDVEMQDVEEGECVDRQNIRSELEQRSEGILNEAKTEPLTKNRRRRNKKKNKKKRGSAMPDAADIDRFVLGVCRRLKEKKSYLVYTAVGCLGVSALNDLVTEVEAIQACGGQKTADGRRNRTGGGILWGILKVRDPNVYREIMERGKEFEKQFRRPNIGHAPFKNRTQSAGIAASGQATAYSDASPNLSPIQEQPNQPMTKDKRVPVRDRMRVPVSYDDLLGVGDEPKYELE